MTYLALAGVIGLVTLVLITVTLVRLDPKRTRRG